MPLEGERARRIITAVLQNIDNWRDRTLQIADNLPPGQKHDALALAKDLTFAQASLRRLAGIDPP